MSGRRSKVQSLPFGLIGAVVLIGFIEAGLRERSIDRATKPGMAWRFGAEASGSDPRAIGAEILCLGDSLVKLGVQPEVLRDRLGQPAFNLAVPGAPAPASLFLLRHALEAGARPKVVVVDFDENLLAVSPSEPGEQWAELLDARDWLDLAWIGLDADLNARVGLTMLLPSWRDRTGIREEIVAALNGRERAILPELRSLERNWDRNAGAQVATPGDRVPQEWSPVPQGQPGRFWKPHPVNAEAVHRLCELAERNGVTVAWLLPPTRPDWRARREAIGAVEPVNRFVTEVQAAHPNVTVIDARNAGFPDDVFRDATHLDGLGAVALSESLAEAIRPLLESFMPTSRWVCASPLPVTRRVNRDRDGGHGSVRRPVGVDCERDPTAMSRHAFPSRNEQRPMPRRFSASGVGAFQSEGSWWSRARFSVALQLRQQAENADVKPDQRDEQAEGAIPLHRLRVAGLRTALDEVKVEQQIEGGHADDDKTEADADRTGSSPQVIGTETPNIERIQLTM